MATGEISAEIDKVEFQSGGPSNAVFDPDWLKVPSIDYVVAAYAHDSSKGEVATISLDDAGAIGAAVTDVAWFDTTLGQVPRLINLGGTAFFAVIYSGPDGDGWLKTFSVASDGTISSMIASLEFDPFDCQQANVGVIHLADTKYAIVYAYRDPGIPAYSGKVVTVNIDDDGTNLSVVDGPNGFFLLELSNQTGPEIIRVSGTVYAILYTARGTNDIRVNTIAIANDGTLVSGAVIESKTIVAPGVTLVTHAQIVKLSNDKYVLAYKDANGATQGASFTITNTGDIGTTLYTKKLIDAGLAGEGIHLLQIVNNYFLVASNSDPNDGWLYSYSIDENTGIFSNSIDSYEFDTLTASRFRILFFAGNLYGILWQGSTNKGFIATFHVERNLFLVNALEDRVTGEIIRVGPGHFSAELRLGGLTTNWNFLDWTAKPLPMIPTEEGWLGPYFEITEEGMRWYWLLPDGSKKYIFNTQ